MVQREIFYCPAVEFIAFDIFIVYASESEKKDGEYLDWDSFVRLMTQVKITFVPEMYRGTLKELTAISPVFESQIYLLHNLQKIDNNLSEGFVLKPIQPKFDQDEQRICIKHKNPKFEEVQKAPKKTEQKVQQEEVQTDFDILRYVTIHRLESVRSQVGELKNKYQYVAPFQKDIIKDFQKDFPEVDIKNKQLQKALQAKIKSVIDEYEKLEQEDQNQA